MVAGPPSLSSGLAGPRPRCDRPGAGRVPTGRPLASLYGRVAPQAWSDAGAVTTRPDPGHLSRCRYGGSGHVGAWPGSPTAARAAPRLADGYLVVTRATFDQTARAVGRIAVSTATSVQIARAVSPLPGDVDDLPIDRGDQDSLVGARPRRWSRCPTPRRHPRSDPATKTMRWLSSDQRALSMKSTPAIGSVRVVPFPPSVSHPAGEPHPPG
jgi:hypothetical protein